MKLHFAPRAVRDLEAIGDYIRSNNPAAAVRVRAASLQVLVQFPHAGRAQSTEGVRKIVARRYPYIVYYSVDAAAQEIIVNHPAREREFSDL